MKKSANALFFILVAGAGIAPTARGYEPREILLLHPAAEHYTTEDTPNQVTAKDALIR